jgi:cytoskeletal protein RodZ
MKEIGEKLRRARKDKPLRMVDVQKITGISTATLTAIETGRHKNFTTGTLKKLAECYGKDIVINLV